MVHCHLSRSCLQRCRHDELNNAFTVTQGGAPRLETNLIVPARVGFFIPIRQTIWIEYKNTGDLPMPAPLLKLTGSNGARLTTDGTITPQTGFGTIPGTGHSVQVLGLGSSSTPWLLQPGETGRIPVYYLGLSQQGFYPDVTFSLDTLTADDARVIDWSTQLLTQLPDLDDDVWAERVARIQDWLGPTWGSYLTRLNEASEFWAFYAQTSNDVASLFNLSLALMNQATSTRSPSLTSLGIVAQSGSSPLHEILDPSNAPNFESPYGWRLFNIGHLHDGIDIAYPNGTSLYAVSGGQGWTAEYLHDIGSGYGNQVKLTNGFVTFYYAHLHSDTAFLYPVGNYGQLEPLLDVLPGQLIAYSSNSGTSAYHLHLRARVGGDNDSVNPLGLFNYNGVAPGTPLRSAASQAISPSEVFLEFTIDAPSWDLDKVEVELVEFNHQPYNGPQYKREFAVAPDSLPTSRRLWHAGSHQWQLKGSAAGLPSTGSTSAPDEWTFRVTAFTLQNRTSSGLFCYSSGGGKCKGGSASVSVKPTSGLMTTEDGGTAQFEVVLTSQPSAPVVISVYSSDPSEGVAGVGTLIFGTDSWSTPQFVTVTGVDDSPADGHVSYQVILDPATSPDPNYEGINPIDVSLTNRDNEGKNGLPGITVVPTSGLITTEYGGQAWFSVVLNTQPQADVTVQVQSTDATEGQVSVSQVAFTSGNWSTAQVVTVIGVDDPIRDGNIQYTIQVGAAASQDPVYNGLDPDDVSVTNRDNEPGPLQLPPCQINCTSGSSQTVSSFDPNDKLAPAGFGDAAFAQADGALAYTIRFENKSDATAPARQIVVTDTLDADLNLDTFVLSEIAFGNQVITIPIGLKSYETAVPMTANGTSILVEVEAAIDRDTRQLTLALRAVDPATAWFPEDPLVGLLYPNDATGRGEGSISYLVRPKASLASGTVIENRARIVFDFNDPIDTPLVFNTLDAGDPISDVAPLPAETIETSFVLSWSGQDEANGSGIAGYDLYVSQDAGPFVPLLLSTTATSTVFTGAYGHTYAFHTIARDNVGHVEAAPEAADAVILVRSPNDPPALDPIDDRTVVEGGTLAFTVTADDPNPGDVLTFILDPGAPDGATIDPATGVFTWTPSDGLASATVTVRVRDSANPALEDFERFTITVENVDPTASLNFPASVDEGTDITVSITSPFDPSPTDTAAGFVYAFDTGSGYGAFSATSHLTIPTTDNEVRTIKAKIRDKDGGETEYSASVTINNVAPTAAITGAPENSAEGMTINLGSLVGDPGTADTHVFQWTVTKNGTLYASGIDRSFSFTPDDNGIYQVTLEVTDDDRDSGTDSKTITVTNVTPSIGDMVGPSSGVRGQPLMLASSFTDAGSADTHTGGSSD